MSKRDPRRIITPDAFTVAPELLGVGLARPSRRLFAIAIDGVCIAILSHVGGKMLLSLGAAVLLWRGARGNRKPQSERPEHNAAPTGGFVRVGMRAASIVAFILFAMALNKWIGEKKRGNDNVAATAQAPDSADDDSDNSDFEFNSEKVSLKDLGLGMADVHMLGVAKSFEEADDSAEAAPYADSIAKWVATKPDTARRRVAATVAGLLAGAPGIAALDASLAPYLPRDTTAAAAAARESERLKRRIVTLEKRNATLAKKYESEKEGFTIKKVLNSLSDFLGFGFGWSALYFTAFTLMMRGQTPGKKLLGIRVIRLDGQPLTGWLSFERFGGYAASAATGLLGFAQILWDRNRQALHDKVTETVVIREKDGVPVRPFENVSPQNPFRAPPTPSRP
jgi:uncharacterized RDD family membrane protein YckC